MELSTATSTEALTRRGQATRDRIVQTAADLVFSHGVAGVSMLEVRRAAHVSGSQLSHYFGDKHSLIRAVIAWQAEAVITIHHMPELGELDSFATLERWADLNIERFEQNDCQRGCSFGSLASELVQWDPSMRADIAIGFERWEALFVHGLTLMRDRHELRANADPVQLTYALMAALQGGMILSQTAGNSEPLRASLRSVLEYLRSLATPR